MKQTYGYIPENGEFERNFLLYADGLGCICNNPEFQIKRDDIGKYLIMSCVSGVLHIMGEEGDVPLKPGMSCFMTLKKPHFYYSDKAEPCELLWIDFNGRYVNELENELLKNRRFFVFRDSEVPKLIAKCIEFAKNKKLGYKTDISAAIYKILMKTLNAGNKKSGEKENDCFVNKFNKYISDNISKKLSLSDMAEHFGWEKAYFCRKCRQELGTSPVRYFNSRKFEIAKYQLMYTSKTVNEISKELGFTDQNYFSYAFYKQTGCYPKSYRSFK